MWMPVSAIMASASTACWMRNMPSPSRCCSTFRRRIISSTRMRRSGCMRGWTITPRSRCTTIPARIMALRPNSVSAGRMSRPSWRTNAPWRSSRNISADMKKGGSYCSPPSRLQRLGQCLGNQFATVIHTVQRDEAAHAWSLRRSQQRLVQRLEPVAQRREGVGLADLINDILNVLGTRPRRKLAKLRIELTQRLRLMRLGRAALERGCDKIAGIGQCMVDQPVQLRIFLGRCLGHIIGEIAPDLLLARLAHHPDQVEQQAEGHR